MERDRPRNPLHSTASALELEDLPTIVDALSAAIRLGAEPLSRHIKSYLDSRPMPADDPIQKALGSLPGLCQDMVRLGESYGLLARWMQEVQELSPREVDVFSLIERVRDRLVGESPQGSGRGGVQLRLPNAPLVAMTDPESLEDSLTLLFGGMLDAEEDCGEASIEVESGPAGWSIILNAPERAPRPLDQYLISDALFPIPHETAGTLVDEEVKLALARERIFRLGGMIGMVREGTKGTVLRIGFET